MRDNEGKDGDDRGQPQFEMMRRMMAGMALAMRSKGSASHTDTSRDQRSSSLQTPRGSTSASAGASTWAFRAFESKFRCSEWMSEKRCTMYTRRTFISCHSRSRRQLGTRGRQTGWKRGR